MSNEINFCSVLPFALYASSHIKMANVDARIAEEVGNRNIIIYYMIQV